MSEKKEYETLRDVDAYLNDYLTKDLFRLKDEFFKPKHAELLQKFGIKDSQDFMMKTQHIVFKNAVKTSQLEYDNHILKMKMYVIYIYAFGNPNNLDYNLKIRWPNSNMWIRGSKYERNIT